MSQELGTTESNARSSIYLKTERLPSFLVGSCSCVEQKVCWRSDLGWLCLGVQRNLFWVLCFRMRRYIVSGAERGRHLGTVLREDVGAKGRRQKDHEVVNLQTRFRSPCSPVADLIA